MAGGKSVATGQTRLIRSDESPSAQPQTGYTERGQNSLPHFWPAAKIGYVVDEAPASKEQLLFIFLPAFDCRNPARLVEDTP